MGLTSSKPRIVEINVRVSRHEKRIWRRVTLASSFSTCTLTVPPLLTIASARFEPPRRLFDLVLLVARFQREQDTRTFWWPAALSKRMTLLPIACMWPPTFALVDSNRFLPVLLERSIQTGSILTQRGFVALRGRYHRRGSIYAGTQGERQAVSRDGIVHERGVAHGHPISAVVLTKV